VTSFTGAAGFAAMLLPAATSHNIHLNCKDELVILLAAEILS
jgi:hypothetical protein